MIGRGRGRAIYAKISAEQESDSDSDAAEKSRRSPVHGQSEGDHDSDTSQSSQPSGDVSGSKSEEDKPSKTPRQGRGGSSRGRLRRTILRGEAGTDSDSDSSSCSSTSTHDTQATQESQDTTKSETSSQATQPAPETSISSPDVSEASETSSTRETSPAPSSLADTSVIQPFEKTKATSGSKIRLTANYIKIQYLNDKRVHLYSVKFEPQIESIRLRKQLLAGCTDIGAKVGKTYIYTGTNLFLPIILDNSIFAVLPHPNDQSSQVSISVEYVKTTTDDQLVMFYNNLFNNVMRELRLVQIRRHHYDPKSKIDIPAHKLELWPGHVCAIQNFDGGLMLTCDTSHRVLRTNTARDMLYEIFTNNRENFDKIAKEKLLGAIVLTRYNNKTYKVDDIDFKRNPTHAFTDASGRSQTYIEYFERQWQLPITDKKQPLLVHRMKLLPGQTVPKIVDLIPEFCYLTGLTDDMRKDNRVMRDLASHTRLSPEARLAKLRDFIKRVNTTPGASRILEDWGISFDTEPITFDGRRLKNEQLLFGNNRKIEVNDTAMWRNDVVNNPMQQAPALKRWIIFYNKRDEQRAKEFCNCLKSAGDKLGFIIDRPKPEALESDNPSTYVQAIKQRTPKECQMVVVMTPGSSQREDRYAAIKRLCLLDLAMPNQCLRANTLNGDKMRSVCQNIALQMAVKLGGQIWSVNIPLKDAMMIGLDSYHDPSNRSASVLAVVATLNASYTKTYTKCAFQSKREEIVNVYNSVLKLILKKYQEVNGTIPKKIFIYRDGVGDGDLNALMEYEIPQIEHALENFVSQTNYQKPSFTFTVVQKRVNTKVFLKRGSGYANPPPGTIADNTVIRENLNSFYLISQHVTQGTVTPTHYILLHNSNASITVDIMQKLTYKLTHLYFNFPATIRVPAMCQYAHKAAYLMGQFVGKDADESLRDKLYYL